MTTITNPTNHDPEAMALAACYRLLLQKARERRERLAKTAVSTSEQQETKHQEVQDGNGRTND